MRVMRTARTMGIRTVAVFSEADANAVHTKFADESVCLGAPEPSASYLDMEKVISAAKQTGADAVHPGYGFLSERAEFSDACAAAGLTFVGPPASAMRRLGAKIDAKQLAVDCGVPIAPGFFEPGSTVDTLRSKADEIGYPIMLKASAGGGGRGMRVVRDPAEFDSACRLAMEESEKAFGDSAMMVEKLIDRPRHIEVQVLADKHGQVACLFERECSIQRRHQKLIEESPSPYMTPDLWERMKSACQSLCQSAGYLGAGTVEFMVDGSTGEFYFLEVNARLQVEHPVTEAVTGLDLVRWQLLIADGEKLDLGPELMQGDRRGLTGHAIEARIVAEDPAKGFLPSVGPIFELVAPEGPGVRFDSGYEAGSEVSRYYDSLVGKVIAHGATRGEAIERLVAALKDTHVLGVHTNICYLLDVLQHPEFVAGRTDTGLLGREFAEWSPGGRDLQFALAASQLAVTSDDGAASGTKVAAPAWSGGDGFRNAASGDA